MPNIIFLGLEKQPLKLLINPKAKGLCNSSDPIFMHELKCSSNHSYISGFLILTIIFSFILSYFSALAHHTTPAAHKFFFKPRNGAMDEGSTGSYIEGGGPTYAARSKPQYISAFATRVLQSTYVYVKEETA